MVTCGSTRFVVLELIMTQQEKGKQRQRERRNMSSVMEIRRCAAWLGGAPLPQIVAREIEQGCQGRDSRRERKRCSQLAASSKQTFASLPSCMKLLRRSSHPVGHASWSCRPCFSMFVCEGAGDQDWSKTT